MGFLLELVLALLALAVAELGVGALLPWPLAAAPLVLVPYALVALGRRALLRGAFARSARLAGLASAWPLVAHLLALFAFGWYEAVARWTGDEPAILGWPGPALLLALAPFLAAELAALDAQARALPAESARALRRFHLRNMLAALAPLGLYLVIAGAIGASPVLRVSIEEVGLYNAGFAAALLGSFALVLPSLLRNTWETEELPDGSVRRALHSLAARAGFRCRAILVWRTGGMLANAAIVGLTPRSRVVLLSDSLLARLELEELAAVFAHEMGHALRRHVPLFLALALAFLLAADLLVGWLAPEDELLALGVLAVVLGLWALLFGALSRRCELDADLVSLDLLGSVEPLVRALEKVGGRLRDVAGWRHFSAAERVAFLRRAVLDPAPTRRLRGRLRFAAWSGGIALALLGVLELVRLSAGLGDDLLLVDLRLGRYARAAERARSAERSEGLRALAQHADALGLAAHPTPGPPGPLVAAALEELGRGEADAARLSLELLLLREGVDGGAPSTALERLEAGDLAGAARELAPLPARAQ
jgi:Zn-dependent protease with chaperone function